MLYQLRDPYRSLFNKENPMSLAIDDLMHEHDAILSSFRILDGMSRALAAGQPIAASDAVVAGVAKLAQKA